MPVISLLCGTSYSYLDKRHLPGLLNEQMQFINLLANKWWDRVTASNDTLGFSEKRGGKFSVLYLWLVCWAFAFKGCAAGYNHYPDCDRARQVRLISVMKFCTRFVQMRKSRQVSSPLTQLYCGLSVLIIISFRIHYKS